MTDEFSLRQARYFLAAVETGTMAAAARQLHISPSAVSLAVTALEQVFGTALLIRTPHRALTLTRVGDGIVGDLRRLVKAADDIMVSARAQAQEPAGRLSIGCFRTLAPSYVPLLVAATSEAYPAVDLAIEERSLHELQESLLAGHLELSLLYDLDLRPDIATEVLTLTRPYVLLGADHRFADRKRIRLRDLAEDPMVMLDVPPSRHYFETLLFDCGIEPTIARTTGSLETLRSLVARNQGWSMLIQRPTINVSYEALPIRSVAIADSLQPMPVVAAWPAGTRLTRRAELFLQLARTTIT